MVKYEEKSYKRLVKRRMNSINVSKVVTGTYTDQDVRENRKAGGSRW